MSRARSFAERLSRPLTLPMLEATQKYIVGNASDLEKFFRKNATSILKNGAGIPPPLRKVFSKNATTILKDVACLCSRSKLSTRDVMSQKKSK